MTAGLTQRQLDGLQLCIIPQTRIIDELQVQMHNVSLTADCHETLLSLAGRRSVVQTYSIKLSEQCSHT